MNSLNISKDLVVDLTNVIDLYGIQNLANTCLFAGGFINFGYWRNIKTNVRITKNKRALASKRLYERVFNLLAVDESDSVLEVGCGLGNGCILLHSKFKPRVIIGVDASPKQIERTISNHKKYLSRYRSEINFIVGSGENIPVSAESVNKIFSIEALQHFDSVDQFLQSSFKSLKSNGKIVVTTFFFKNDLKSDLLRCFPNFKSGVDKIVRINSFLNKLKDQGFIQIKSQSIGRFVWHGFDRWILQTRYKDTWDKYWIQAYKAGMLDYYIIEATKP